MRGTVSYLFCSIVMAALAAVAAAGEEPDVNAAAASPWTKNCLSDLCIVGKGGWSYCGFIGEVGLAERKSETGKVLSIGLPPRRIDPAGAVRFTIDSSEPVSGTIATCNTFVCRADYAAGAELVEQLKHGRLFVVEAVAGDGTPYTLTMPLAGFAKAYDGPPMPVPEVREASQTEIKAHHEQSERAAVERRARCGSQPSP